MKLPEKWLIWSNEHEAWWKRDEKGYTRWKSDAGTYTLERALEIVTNANAHINWSFVPVEDTPIPNECLVPFYDNSIDGPKKIVVWDLETTGLDCHTSKILEIGAMVFHEGSDQVEQISSWVLNHNVEIPNQITEITGIDSAVIEREGQDPVKAMREFLEIVTTADINITHNGVRFDIPFLVESARQVLGYNDAQANDLRLFMEKTAQDTAAYYKGDKLNMTQRPGESFKGYADRVMGTIVKGLKYNVGHCCDDLGIDRSNVTQHRALGDVHLTYEIYKKLINQK